MNFTNENRNLIVFPSGRVDSSNADKIGAEIEEIRAANPHDTMTLDIETLEYISSAGLRVILRVRKEEPTLKILNASSEVYEIFEMTGFTEMLSIEKAYRRLSVDGCEVIGQGANGVVYRLDPDTIIKVYRSSDCLPDIQRERELARKAFVLGIPTAIPYDVVKVGESYGSVFELLNAKSFAKLISAEPEKLDYYVGLYVELLKKIHATVVKHGDMPDEREVVIKWATDLLPHLSEAEGKKLLSLVEAVPVDDHMMHGDYHIKNVMMQNGEVLLIDMDTLCLGNPVFEFASVYLAYIGFSEIDPSNVERFLGIDRNVAKAIWDKTLRMYFGTDDAEKLREYSDKARVVAYTRLLRRTLRRESDTEEGKKMIAHCREELSALLSRVDSILM